MPKSKNTKSKKYREILPPKELEAHMNNLAEKMRINNNLARKFPIPPGQGFKPNTSSTVKLMIPEIKYMAERDREKKLKNEFRPYMEKAKTQSIKKRLDNLNKSSPKAKTQSIKKRLDNVNKSSPKKEELLDLETELSDEKWYGGKKRRKQKTKKHKKKQKTRKNRKKSKK
tara:strand:+ start:1182 stop:1694 length:513 start_codon:yes stop_codon:yes gene_type:complete